MKRFFTMSKMLPHLRLATFALAGAAPVALLPVTPAGQLIDLVTEDGQTLKGQ